MTYADLMHEHTMHLLERLAAQLKEKGLEVTGHAVRRDQRGLLASDGNIYWLDGPVKRDL